MRRHAWALIGLEHLVGERVCLSHGQIWRDVIGIDIHKLRIRRRAIGGSRSARYWNQIRAIHLTCAGCVQVAPVEFTPLLAMLYWDALGLVLQALADP